MTLIDPNKYNSKKAVEFYKQYLTSLGCAAGRISITPYSNSGDFIVTATAGGADFYFDIGNAGLPLNPAQLATYTQKSVYFGSLKVSTYVGAVGSGSINYTAWLSTGPPVNLTNFLYKIKQGIVAGDSNVNVDAASLPLLDQFDNAIFSFLHLNVNSAVGATTVTQEYLFDGLKIDY